jgi:hypothetical protein
VCSSDPGRSPIGLYKNECIATTVFHDGPYKILPDVEYATAGWVDWYNHRRRRGSLDYVPPVEYEQAHYAALQPQEQPKMKAARKANQFTWTRKVDNKTVTRTLNPDRAQRLQTVIDNARKLHELVAELETLALDNLDEDPPTARS